MNEPFLGFIGISTNTELLLYNGKEYEILGMDIDMPLGLAYSQISFALGLSLNEITETRDCEIINYPIPMLNHKGLDFSFAGAYYHTLQRIYPKRKELPKRSELLDPCFLNTNSEGMKILAASFQNAIITQVCNRVTKAIKWVKANYGNIRVFVNLI